MSKTAKSQRWPSDGPPSADPNPNVVPIRVEGGSDPLDSFTPETGAAAPRRALTVVRVQTKSIVALSTLLAIAAIAVGVFFLRQRLEPPRTAPAALSGRVLLNSRPAGVAVFVDGISRGATPLDIELASGTHDVLFRSGASERRIDVKVDANVRTAENVDMPPAALSTGVLEVTSEPAGARVSMDGTSAGVTPLTIRNVAAARHTLVIGNGSTSVNRTVQVAAGATASIFVALAQTASSSGGTTGTFAVESPLELRILENGQLLGLSNAAPIVVSAGKHQFDLVNETLDLHLTRAVAVDAGKPTRLSISVPNGTLSVNAMPWAEVFVDGRTIGVTPLGSVTMPVGSHEIVWRHPQLGERRRTVVVGAQKPTRVTMDLSK